MGETKSIEERLAALESRPRNRENAEEWLLIKARRLALARRGFTMSSTHLDRVPEYERASWLAVCEREVSVAIDGLVTAAIADGLAVTA